jgi:O-acetyl-ADP-ribose deacetylase (regulator of RNase III)
MLLYVKSNIFDSPAQTIVNAVNTVGVMGKGIAQEFKKRYPDMFERYREFCKRGDIDIGRLYLYRSPNKWVLNFPTKRHWRQPSKAEYIERGLDKFVRTYTQQGITSISFPQLGTGNGGLDWNRAVRPMMEEYLVDLPIPVYIHSVAKPTDFVPEHLAAIGEAGISQSRARREITFPTFLADLQRITGHPERVLAIEPLRSIAEPAPLPSVCVNSRMPELPGEDFEELWSSLRILGALPVSRFPERLRPHARTVTALLAQLEYLELLQFSAEGEDDLGIRYAPRADEGEPEAEVACS